MVSQGLQLVAERVRIYPDAQQEVYLRKSCGVARFAYNWALDQWKTQHSLGQKVNWMSLSKQFNSIKHEQFPWVNEVSKCCPARAIQNLGKAFDNFFRKLKKGDKKGFPKFKKKNKKDSFYLANDAFSVTDKQLKVPKQEKPIELAACLKKTGRFLSVTIVREGSKWYANFVTESNETVPELPEPANDIIGVDLGVKTLATLSNGEAIENPKHLRSKLKKLRRLNRQLARAKKGSKRREKAKVRLSNFHRKVRLSRKDTVHKTTNLVVRSAKVIVIEDLAVKNMLKNHKLALSIADVGFGMFRATLESKCKKYNRQLVIVDRFFPSSKMCSNCGIVKEELKLSERTFACEGCGARLDRDVNAAINLEKQGRLLLGRTCTEVQNARRDCISPRKRGSSRRSENKPRQNNCLGDLS